MKNKIIKSEKKERTKKWVRNFRLAFRFMDTGSSENPENFKAVMQKVKDFGYDGVELAGLYGLKPEYVKQVLDEVGLDPDQRACSICRDDGKSGSDFEGLCSDRCEISGHALYGRGISTGESGGISEIPSPVK